MVGRVLVADDFVNLAEAVNDVVVGLVPPHVFEERATAALDGRVVVGRERQHVALGSVVDDPDRLVLQPLAYGRLALAEEVVAARPVRRLHLGEDARPVAVALEALALLHQPDLLRPIIGQTALRRLRVDG